MLKRIKQFGASILASSMVLGMVAGVEADVHAAGEPEIGVSDLTEKNTVAPGSWGEIPSPNQYRYQKQELAAFCHFGPNTFENVEWGEKYGDRAPSDIFRLENDFDAETMVRAMQDAGFQKLIITAKHHDGFCLWNSAYTDYCVKSTDYKNGEGDILAEISAACTKYNLDMGLYLSPWDIHEPSYGYYDANGNATTEENDVLDYNEYYNNQLKEILGNDKYGNNGHFVEVWMDGAKGSGANAQEYDFNLWFSTIQQYEGIDAGYDDDCLLFGAEAYTTVRWIGNELGLANEETWSKSQVDYEKNTINSYSVTVGGTGYTMGSAEGNQWTVPEADSRITSGWFWGPGKKEPKSIQELSNMYFNSVGHNAVMLLNIPPNTDGTIDQDILDRMKEFGDNIKTSFANNLAENAVVTASEVRGNDMAFSPANVIDGDDDTYWTMEDGSTTGSLTLDLGGTRKFDMVTIEEAIQLGQRIKSFEIKYKLGDGDWQDFSQGTTIGAKRICREKAVTADKIQISITGSYDVPLISEVGVYKASKDFEIPSPIPDGLEKILVSDTDASDGSGFTFTGTWTNETGNEFIDGVATWANSGATATLKFTGHKVWLFGTKDPKHGTADVYIDGEKVGSFDTNASVRATGQMIYETDDLEPGDHTLEIRATGIIGLNAAAVLNNGGKGVIQFERETLTMEEDSVENVVVKRVGGSSGSVTVAYENNPGSAVQGNYDVDGIRGALVFEDGETEKTICVTTKRDLGVKGDLNFTVDLVSVSGGAILGFNTSLGVIIRDLDDPNRKEEWRDILEEYKALNYELYLTEGAENVKKLAAQLNAYLEAEDGIMFSDILKVSQALQAAKAQLTARETYSAEDPFVLPVGSEVKTVEAEFFTLDASEAVDAESNYVRVTERADASNGKEINWFEEGNRISLPFLAPKTGVYQVTATYRSGRAQNNPNSLEWSGTNVASGSIDVYGENNAMDFHSAVFEITVTKEGAGELVFTASSKGGPVIDKFEIECQEKTPVPVTGVSLDRTSITIADDAVYEMLFASVEPSNATNQNVTFQSADPEIAKVDAYGIVTGLKNGKTDITVTSKDGGKTAVCHVIVNRLEFALNDLDQVLSDFAEIANGGMGNYTKDSWDTFIGLYNQASDRNEILSVQQLEDLLLKLAKAKEDLEIDTSQKPGSQAPDSQKPDSQAPNSGSNSQTAKPLNAPSGVKAASKVTGVQITFTKTANAASYEIYRQSGTNAAAKIADVTEASYVDTNAPGGIKLTYTVKAVSGSSSYTDSAFSAPASLTLPKAVKKLTVKSVSGGAKISFKKVKGAKSYIIYRASKKNGVYKKVKTLKAKKTTYIDKKAKKGKNFYKVITVKGNTYSPATKPKKVKIKK